MIEILCPHGLGLPHLIGDAIMLLSGGLSAASVWFAAHCTWKNRKNPSNRIQEAKDGDSKSLEP